MKGYKTTDTRLVNLFKDATVGATLKGKRLTVSGIKESSLPKHERLLSIRFNC